MKENQNRKLSAILFADIVGYTSLMQKDEATANILLDKFHKTLSEKVIFYKGQVINNYGDGCVCTFDSAVAAMNCAKEVQNTFQQNPRVPVRIGLHSGDVMFKGDNVYGDSVNIASRIESLGVAGAILFSKQIKRHISNQTAFEVQSLGAFDFKNVEKTMEVFALANKGMVIPKRAKIKGKVKPSKRKWVLPAIICTLGLIGILLFQSGFFSKKEFKEGEVSLAIVPFRNISGDDTNNHFGMGMASEIRTKLSMSKKFASLSSLQATAAYANTTLLPKEIGEKLNVDYLMMGMFQVDGDNIRVNVELLDAASGENVEEIPPYQNKFTDIFSIQNEIANRVLHQFSFFNQEHQKNNTSNEYTPDVVAYGHYLKGKEILATGWNTTIWDDALQQFELATQLDSNYLSPWVGQIHVLTDLLWFEKDKDTLLRKRTASTMEYIENNFPESWEKNYARGIYEYHGLSNYEKGKQFLVKALEENPEDSEINSMIAAIYKRGLQLEEALFYIAKAKNQSPNDATIWSDIGEISMIQGDYTVALEASKTILNLGDIAQGQTRLLWLAFTLGDVSIIPESRELDYGSFIIFYKNYFDKNWKECLTILDTTKVWEYDGQIEPDFKLFHKAKIFHIDNQMDSCQYYATQLLKFYEDHPTVYHPERKAFAFSMLGKRNESNTLIHSGVFNNFNWVILDDEELLRSASRMKTEVDNFIFLNDYKKATETLISLNKKYPSYGDFEEYKTDPFYNRIKKNYPPFAKAVKELKRPDLIPFDESLKG